jgi:hypothetical protein
MPLGLALEVIAFWGLIFLVSAYWLHRQRSTLQFKWKRKTKFIKL